VRDVLARHPVLLARFATEDGHLTWTPGAGFELPHIDLRGAVAEFGEDVFDRLVEEEAGIVADLRHAAPFRALLARLGPKDWGLLVVVDHIVCDGWSLSVFLGDLADAYNHRLRGQTPTTARAYGFAEFCRDERVRRADAGIAELWRGIGATGVARDPIPTSTPVAAGSGRYTRWVDDDLAAGIRELAGRSGTTPYLVFTTALAALVHSGGDARETVLLGTLIAQRDRPEWRRVVGPLLNVSVLAADVALTDAVPDALLRTRDGALRAYRSAHVPFQELVSLLGMGGTPFDVLVVMQPPGTTAEFDGLTTELTDIDDAAVPYPLTVDIEAHGDRYRVSYRYQADRYAAADVEALAARLHAVLGLMAGGTEGTLAELRESTARERS
jgi:hypothetical protein